MKVEACKKEYQTWPKSSKKLVKEKIEKLWCSKDLNASDPMTTKVDSSGDKQWHLFWNTNFPINNSGYVHLGRKLAPHLISSYLSTSSMQQWRNAVETQSNKKIHHMRIEPVTDTFYIVTLWLK